MAQRRLVVAQKPHAKRHAFAKQIQALNHSFYDWLQNQINKDPLSSLMDGAQVGGCYCAIAGEGKSLKISLQQDYVDHVTSLEDRYLRTYGEVLTFGSGDCGQLAHGIEEDNDLMVKYPRVVYSLRYA
jgi:hypothetical protein